MSFDQKEYMRLYFIKNRKRLLTQQRKNYYLKREERIAKTKLWKSRNPEKAKEHLRRSTAMSKKRHRHKNLTRLKTYHAVKKGKILKENCAICNSSENLEAHHPNYKDPFNITWLCRKHHKLLHRKRG